ncbi:MAG TPA: class I SAM-dependent methyltransferase [Candidatus Hodarchaeales archaeon]|nr:class I SAM-dependent methyltransferase [Candidatus Hodarchaeales archaeon]
MSRTDPRIQIFEDYANEYDEWFLKNAFAYQSEVAALKQFVPPVGTGVEIGAGTGRFAKPLGIQIGVEPAKSMAVLARDRGIAVVRAVAERLPFQESCFDSALMVTTICFLKDPLAALREALRVLKPEGVLVLGIIDKESPIGEAYESSKESSKFYHDARFYSVSEVQRWLETLPCRLIGISQTIFTPPAILTEVEPPKEGYGEGGFVAIAAAKANVE